MSATAVAKCSFHRVAVYGAGLMGSGIAQVAATAGFNVALVDVNAGALSTAVERIKKSLGASAAASAARAGRGLAPGPAIDEAAVLARVETMTDAGAAASTADLVVECVVEKMDIKHRLLREIETHAPPRAVFATNTSSLPVAGIAAGLAGADRRARFAGLHFFNPVPSMPLVEVVATDATVRDVLDELHAFCAALGKVAVACKDTPGFIVNRLLVPYMMEAVRMAERGDASIKDIDLAMKNGAGYPMGPFELADFVGLDTVSYIVSGWHKDGAGLKGSEIVAPSKMLNDLVKQGRLGRKSGAGFYEYPKKTKKPE